MSNSQREVRRYFYARVSTKKQNLARQIEAARRYYNIPDEDIFWDKQSGKNLNRDEYQRMKSLLVEGDEVVVLSLDRLSRNKEDMKSELAWYRERGITVRVLNIPTTLIEFGEGQDWIKDMVNNILIEVMGAIAQQEREMILERQAEGIEAMPVDEEGHKVSTKTGQRFGRKKKDLPENIGEIVRRQKAGELTVAEAMKAAGVGRTRWYEITREGVA